MMTEEMEIIKKDYLDKGYSEVIYISKYYPGPIAYDIQSSKELIEYHKNSVIQVHLPKENQQKLHYQTLAMFNKTNFTTLTSFSTHIE